VALHTHWTFPVARRLFVIDVTNSSSRRYVPSKLVNILSSKSTDENAWRSSIL